MTGNLTSNEIRKRVSSEIQELTGCDPREVTQDAHLENDLRLDELDRVELVMMLEQAFDHAFDEAQADAFTHVRDIVAYLQREAGVVDGVV